jgi:hypothetical protein
MRTTLRRVIVICCAAGLLMAVPVQAQKASSSIERQPPDARLDGSTANQAKRTIEAAGWRDVKELRKGYDGVWHGMATKDGTRRRVAVTPDGVYPEGD